MWITGSIIYLTRQRPACSWASVQSAEGPKLYEEAMQNGDGIQFSHTTEEQIGGLLEAGFCLTHLYEDTNEREIFTNMNPTFLAMRAQKKMNSGQE